ncbi:PCMD domain-containing protein [Flammeovirga pacifica]|uniref:Putative carbohydrate metabolism domain-containing protein n=1 Tax=Flammeovirga pacifica TaxID=915059 RepID=A0A1S1YU27_FLAPC|nr:PCMD domain-containing protein [Flammeovirga pacifica]OHX64544.1 hypothetical protein NH26_23510 [Flammeovirga pacifica]
MQKYIFSFISLLVLSSCLKNDIPYPYIFGSVNSFQIEGQKGNAIISDEHMTIEVKVPYGTDLSQLKVADIDIIEGGTFSPKKEEMTDFTQGIDFMVTTYQDYTWSISVIEDDFNIVIHQLEIEGQISSDIDELNQKITVIIPNNLSIEQLKVVSFDYFPTSVEAVPNIFEVVDFTTPQKVSFEGIEWTIEVLYEDDNIELVGDQIVFSNFMSWYYGGRKSDESNNSRKFYLPGEEFDTTPWRSGDVGAADLIIPTGVETVYPSPSIYNYEYTTLKTTSALGVVAAGSLFVGDIQGSGLVNVQTDFGIPFTDRPRSFTTNIQYIPETYKGDLDQCDIYVLLQVREGSGDDEKRYRLATGWFRSDEVMLNFKELNIPLLYGNHNDLAPFMMPSSSNTRLPEHGFASTDLEPTHIVVVFSSSFDGANFNGGVGSELRIKNFDLKY